MASEVDESVGVTILVVIPGNDLDKLGAHLDASLSVEGGASWVGHEVLADNIFLGVVENTLSSQEEFENNTLRVV